MTKTLLLLLILLLAGFMAFIPHIGYAYPLHGDEWMHLTYAKTIAQTGAISFPDPFTGEGTIGPGSNVWLGYHVLMAIVQRVSGIDWLVLWRFGPSVIFMLTVLCVYIFANKQGYGLEAAFFTCLIPTTGGLLGPAFMVPMALGLLFIPLSLYIAFYVKAWPSYLLLFLVTFFLWSMHPTTAAIQGIVTLPFILINIKGSPVRSLGLLATLLLPVLIALPFTVNQLLPEIGQLLVPKGVFPPPWLDLPAMLQIYGIIPLISCFAGIIYLFKRGNKYNCGLLIGLVLLLIIMLAFARFQVGMDTIFQRGMTTALLLVGIIAGAGMYWLRTKLLSMRLSDTYQTRRTAYDSGFLCAIAVVAILSVAIPSHFNVPYYHMIDDQDYMSFVWIKDNIGPEYETALVDPWKATAFVAVAEKKILRRIWIEQEPVDDIIYRELAAGCQDSGFLRENRVSMVYNRMPCRNPNLVKVSDNVYITGPNISGSFDTKEGLQNGGFEAVYGKPPAFWDKYTENCAPAFLFPEAGRNTGSSVAIRIDQTAPFKAKPWVAWYQRIPVIEGKAYNVGGWIKTEDVAGQVGVRISMHWLGPDKITISDTTMMEYIKGTTGWTYYQGRVNVPPGAVFCNVALIMADCSGTVWFDDILVAAE